MAKIKDPDNEPEDPPVPPQQGYVRSADTPLTDPTDFPNPVGDIFSGLGTLAHNAIGGIQTIQKAVAPPTGMSDQDAINFYRNPLNDLAGIGFGPEADAIGQGTSAIARRIGQGVGKWFSRGEPAISDAAPVINRAADSATGAAAGELTPNAAGKYVVGGQEYPTWIAARAAQKLLPQAEADIAEGAGNLAARRGALTGVGPIARRLGAAGVGAAVGVNLGNSILNPKPRTAPPPASPSPVPGGGPNAAPGGPRVPYAPSLAPIQIPTNNRTPINPVAPVRGTRRGAIYTPPPSNARQVVAQTIHRARGGIIPEEVIGRGLTSGRTYEFGEEGPEHVVPGPGNDPSSSGRYATGGTIGFDPAEQQRLIAGEQQRVGASNVSREDNGMPAAPPTPQAPVNAPSPAGTSGQAAPGSEQYDYYRRVASGQAPTDPNVSNSYGKSYVDLHPDSLNAFVDANERAGDQAEARASGAADTLRQQQQGPMSGATASGTGPVNPATGRPYTFSDMNPTMNGGQSGMPQRAIDTLPNGGASTDQNGILGVHPQVLNELQQTMQSLSQQMSQPGVGTDVQAVFLQQGQQIQDMIKAQMDQAKQNAADQGKALDPATQAQFDRMEEAFGLQLKQVKEDLARRGLYDSGVELEMESRLRRGLSTDEAQIAGQRLTGIQNDLYKTLSGLQGQMVQSQQAMGLAGAQAYQQAIEKGMDRNQAMQIAILTNQMEMAKMQQQGSQFEESNQTTQYGQDQQAYLQELALQQAQEQQQGQLGYQYAGLNNQRDIINAELQAGRYAGSNSQPSANTTKVITDNYIAQFDNAQDYQTAMDAFNREAAQMEANGADLNTIRQYIEQKFGGGFKWPGQ